MCPPRRPRQRRRKIPDDSVKPAPGPGILSAGHVPVGEGHDIYVETSGNPGGVPVVFLHGGPGSGFRAEQRRLFPPDAFLVMFDQRGAGQSRPSRSRIDNTTDHLIADMERLREHLGIRRWIVTGGSWGATLALAYAERHAERVAGLVLRSVFLGTRQELETAFLHNSALFHPDLHRDFLALLPPSERDDPLPAYWARILGPDMAESRRFAHAWHDTERILSVIAPLQARLDPATLDDPARPLPSTPFMEAHYFSQGCFLDHRPLLENAAALHGIPGIIIQARHDLLCPPATSHALAARWPDAEIRHVEQAGHSVSDGTTAETLKAAIHDMSARAEP